MKSPLVWIGKVPRASVCSADARVDRFRRVLQGSSGFWSLMVKKVAGFRNYLCYGIAIKKNSRVPCTVCDSCAERVEKMFFLKNATSASSIVVAPLYMQNFRRWDHLPLPKESKVIGCCPSYVVSACAIL